MVDIPLNIRRFEILQLVSVSVGFSLTLADGTFVDNIVRAARSNLIGAARGDALGEAIGAAIGDVVGIAIVISLTLLVSRRRKNWARWTLLVFEMSGLVLVVAEGQSGAMFSQPYTLLTALVWLTQAVAMVLLFTPQSGRWLRGDPCNDLRQAFD